MGKNSVKSQKTTEKTKRLSSGKSPFFKQRQELGDVNEMINTQKNNLLMHRILYIVFFLSRMLLHFSSSNIKVIDTVMITIFLVSCAVLEEVFAAVSYFRSVKLIRFFRYVQCVLASFMIIFVNAHRDSELMIIALVILFAMDYFIAMEVLDGQSALFCTIYIAIPLFAFLVLQMSIKSGEEWMYIMLNSLMIFIVLGFELYSFVGYLRKIDMLISDQRATIQSIEKKNANIVLMQEKLQNTNSQLNYQRIELERVNKQIREANQEMITQTEILHYISSSFDVAKISDQITDSIMDVKKLAFCAVFIDKNVYMNKKPSYVIKTNVGQLSDKITENMNRIYNDMIADGETERVFHENIKENFSFLGDVLVQSVYTRVLRKDDENYGLIMLGDVRKSWFLENMSFYEAIIAQYNIAISNARIYNEVQNMARKDGLTGINNRIYFNELFKKEASKIVSEGGHISAALFDIDKFKRVNDTYGHLAGDEVIKRIAHVTEDVIEEYNGFVCRYGGEEFVAVLPGKDINEAKPVIEELFEKLCSQVVEYNEYKIPMSVSVGLTAYPEVCEDTDQLLKRADWCMYYAKENGRHQIKVDDGTINRD